MAKPAGQSCATCQYFGIDYTPTEADGVCARYPPRIVSDVPTVKTTNYPITNRDWWCGEYKQGTLPSP